MDSDTDRPLQGPTADDFIPFDFRIHAHNQSVSTFSHVKIGGIYARHFRSRIESHICKLIDTYGSVCGGVGWSNWKTFTFKSFCYCQRYTIQFDTRPSIHRICARTLNRYHAKSTNNFRKHIRQRACSTSHSHTHYVEWHFVLGFSINDSSNWFRIVEMGFFHHV